MFLLVVNYHRQSAAAHNKVMVIDGIDVMGNIKQNMAIMTGTDEGTLLTMEQHIMQGSNPRDCVAKVFSDVLQYLAFHFNSTRTGNSVACSL